MSSFGKTAVYNDPNKILNLPPYYYRYRSPFFSNLNGNGAADQYQRLKLIQNTVRVYSSLYTSNLGPLNAYKQPTAATQGVCWNQMSDRPVPSVQRATVPTGFNNNLNGRHHSVTSSKPGSQTPGGTGCDIKHNSYDRYLNRLKGKGPLRRGPIPANFGTPIPFNPAIPVYGGKTTKTNIVNGCDCPIESKALDEKQDIRIYNNPLYYPDPNSNYGFSVGQYVYAIKPGTDYFSKAVVTNVNGNIYTITFTDGTVDIQNVNQLLIYFPCNCEGLPTTDFSPYSIEFLKYVKTKLSSFCNVINQLQEIQQQY